MSTRDSARSRVYEAERLVHRMFDRAGTGRVVELAGTQVTMPPEARFSSAEAVADHVTKVLAMPSVRERFPRAAVPVSVRSRRGHRAAEYHRLTAEIAIPESTDGRWALRELVVLHELAHHLDDSGGPSHGRGFVICLIDLVDLVLGPEAAFGYRVIFGDSGVGP